MIPTREIAGHKVGAIGHGLMSLTWVENPTPDEQAFESMKAAADAGATFWNAGTFYGENYINLKLLNRFFEMYPEYIDKIYLSVKGGFTMKGGPMKTIDEFQKELTEAQEALGKKKIDLFQPARVPKHQPIEDTMKLLVQLKEQGFFSDIGLSEARADTLRRAHAVHPVAAVEIEVSLWTFDEEVRKVIAAGEELNIAVVGYSPLGRGFLTRKFKKPEDIEQEHTKSLPRLQGDAFYANLKLVDRVEEIAKEVGCEPAQLCLAYLLEASPKLIPIPGTTNASRAKSNIASGNVKLSQENIKAIQDALAKIDIVGERAPEHLAAINWG